MSLQSSTPIRGSRVERRLLPVVDHSVVHGLTLRVRSLLQGGKGFSVFRDDSLRGDRLLAILFPDVYVAVVVDLLSVGRVGVRVALPRNILAVEPGHVAAVGRVAFRVHPVRSEFDSVSGRLELQRQAFRSGSRLVPGFRGVELPGAQPVFGCESDRTRENDGATHCQGNHERVLPHDYLLRSKQSSWNSLAD